MNHATGQQMVFLYLSGGDMEVIGWEFFNSKFTVISHSCKNHINFLQTFEKMYKYDTKALKKAQKANVNHWPIIYQLPAMCKTQY